MNRLARLAALIGALTVGAAQTPPDQPSPPVAKGTKITVVCHGVGPFDIFRNDSVADKLCRAKLLDACPNGYHDLHGITAGEPRTFEITCR